MDEVLSQSKFEIALANSYVDFSNYEKPIQTFIDDGQYEEVTIGLRKKLDIYVQENKGDLNTAIAYNEGKNSQKFYQVSNAETSFKGFDINDPKIITMYFRADDQTITYKRSTYTLIDALAKIGGFYKFVMMAFNIVIMMFIEGLFYTVVMSKIYHIEDKRPDVSSIADSRHTFTPDHPLQKFTINDKKGFYNKPIKSSSENSFDDDKGITDPFMKKKPFNILSQSVKLNGDSNDPKVLKSHIKEMQRGDIDELKLADTTHSLKSYIFNKKLFTYTQFDSIMYVLKCFK